MKLSLIARRFVAGDTLESAIIVAKKLQKESIKSTLDHLGEDVTDRVEANKATIIYIKILERIKKEKLNSNISIKLSQIGLAIDRNLARKNAEKIFAKAKSLKLAVEIDMESSKYTEDTLVIFSQLNKKYSNTIQAVQAYLYRTRDDLENIMKFKGKIRLVKGSYKETKTIALQKMVDVRLQYIKLMKIYLAQGNLIEVATHDEDIILNAKKFTKKYSTPKNKFEFEMLYGVRSDLCKQLAQEGYTVRVYIPYGKNWFKYFFRRIRERKENLLFVLKHLVGK